MSGEKVFQPFMTIMIFVIVGAFMLAMCSQFFKSGEAVSNEADDNQSILGMWNYTFYEPLDGYEVDNSTVLDHWPDGETGGLTFGDDDDPNDKRIYIVRDSEDYKQGSDKVWKKFPDYIGIKRKADDVLGGKVYRWAAPLEKFVANFDKETNVSQVDFSMSGHNYTIFLELVDNNTDRIWWNNYTIRLAATVFQDDLSVWAAIGLIMTADLPGCNEYINILLACVVDFAMIFVVINLVLRIWSGG